VRLDRSCEVQPLARTAPVKGAFGLAPLTDELVDLDTRAYLESPAAITAHSAGRWPVKGWLRAWRPDAAVFRCLPGEMEILDALTKAGLHQISAAQQELPYRWFMRR
jgi:hypothetical protein